LNFCAAQWAVQQQSTFRHDLSVPRSLRSQSTRLLIAHACRALIQSLGSGSVNSQNIIRCAFKHWEEGAEGACIYGRINASATPRRARVSGG